MEPRSSESHWCLSGVELLSDSSLLQGSLLLCLGLGGPALVLADWQWWHSGLGTGWGGGAAADTAPAQPSRPPQTEAVGIVALVSHHLPRLNHPRFQPQTTCPENVLEVEGFGGWCRLWDVGGERWWCDRRDVATAGGGCRGRLEAPSATAPSLLLLVGKAPENSNQAGTA